MNWEIIKNLFQQLSYVEKNTFSSYWNSQKEQTAANGEGLWLGYKHPCCCCCAFWRNLENFTRQTLFLKISPPRPLVCAIGWWCFLLSVLIFYLSLVFLTPYSLVWKLVGDGLLGPTQAMTTNGKDLLWTVQDWYQGPGASSFKSRCQQMGIQALKFGFGKWKLGLRLPDGKRKGPGGTWHLLRSGPWWNWCYTEAGNVL